ncbi:hypothetical protein [Pararhizobium mangrovi]|uniref:LPS-assembly lipoprotein n=1 Tax=Pararhizobium mangrovi TaxID=2590452 RepID=A0A506U2P8_9HYPH|nr:hypothetical protein [Pararhizobium mangrovi]TPW27275.1 hypothetical protein FJU11_12030 [Pararhizobium mangrovi]
MAEAGRSVGPSRSFRFRSIRITAALAAPLLVLSACQVRPIYAKSNPERIKLASISVAPVTGRSSQIVRNRLLFLLDHGGAEPRNPAYLVNLTVTMKAIGVFNKGFSESPTAGDLKATVRYTLVDTKTKKAIHTGTRTAIAAYDLPSNPAQEYAKLRAARDATQRSLESAAALVRDDIAGFLAR